MPRPGSYSKIERETQPKSDPPKVAVDSIEWRGRSGTKLLVPGAIVLGFFGIISAYIAKLTPGPSPETRELAEVKQELNELQKYLRDRDDKMIDRISKVEAGVSLAHSNHSTLRRELESCCARGR